MPVIAPPAPALPLRAPVPSTPGGGGAAPPIAPFNPATPYPGPTFTVPGTDIQVPDTSAPIRYPNFLDPPGGAGNNPDNPPAPGDYTGDPLGDRGPTITGDPLDYARRDPRRSRKKPNNPPTYGRRGQSLWVTYRVTTWDGVVVDSGRGGAAPFGGLVAQRNSSGQLAYYMQFDGYLEPLGADPLPNPSDPRDFSGKWVITGVKPFADREGPDVKPRPAPDTLPPDEDAPAPRPVQPPPYNDPKPFRRRRKEPAPEPATPPAPVPTGPPEPGVTPEPTPLPPGRERKVPSPLPTPDQPGTPVQPSPAPSPSPRPDPRRPEIPPDRPLPDSPNFPATVPGRRQPGPTPGQIPDTTPLDPARIPVYYPTSTPGQSVPNSVPAIAPPRVPPKNTVIIASGNPDGPGGTRVPPSFPVPIPFPLFPPTTNYDCCDDTAVLKAIRDAKQELQDRLIDIERCACPLPYTDQETNLFSASNNGSFALPAGAIRLKLITEIQDGNIRGEWGGGFAPDVLYVGWYSLSSTETAGGDRNPISYGEHIVYLEPGHRWIHFTCRGESKIRATVVRRVATGAGQSPPFSSGVRVSELLYRGV